MLCCSRSDLCHFRDCYPLNILQDNQDSRFEVCRISFLESIAATGVVNNDNWLTFYQCIMLLNSQPVPGSTMLGGMDEHGFCNVMAMADT